MMIPGLAISDLTAGWVEEGTTLSDIFMEEDFCDELLEVDGATGDDTKIVENTVAATGTSGTLDELNLIILG